MAPRSALPQRTAYAAALRSRSRRSMPPASAWRSSAVRICRRCARLLRRASPENSGRAADCQRIDAQCRLTDTDRHALAILAAGADTLIELQVVADHGDARQYIRTVADQRRALERCAEAAVLDRIGLARREHELARSDVHLAATEVHRVDAALDRTDDVLGSMRTGAHVGVGHARQRHVSEGLAPAIAGGRGAHEARIEPVLHVAAQHAVLDEGRALGRRALVVDVERAAPARQRTVIDHGALRSRNALPDAVGKGGRALAIEIPLEPVTDRLVQQDPGPARPEYYGHGAGGRRAGLEVHQRLPRRLAGQGEWALAGDQLAQCVAAAGPGITLFA